MKQLSGQKTGDIVTAAGEWEQFTKELENLALRRGVALDGADLTQVLKAVQWGEVKLLASSVVYAASASRELLVGADMFADFDVVRLDMINVAPSTDDVSLRVQLYRQGASAYEVGATYVTTGIGSDELGASFAWAGSYDTYASITPTGVYAMGSSSYEHLHGYIEFYNPDPHPGSGTGLINYNGSLSYGEATVNPVGQHVGVTVHGRCSQVGPWGGMKVYASSGNINGMFKLWGIPRIV
jgi:hypothetical protein